MEFVAQIEPPHRLVLAEVAMTIKIVVQLVTILWIFTTLSTIEIAVQISLAFY